MSDVLYEFMNCNGVPYKKDAAGEWVPDEEAYNRQCLREHDEQKRKDELIWALRSRVLSVEEMGEVKSQGTWLYLRVQSGVSQNYNENELIARLNADLLQQFNLRLAAERATSAPDQ